jgi:ABC-type dipeptide/oligopeptide/nickel transport system permease component
MVMVTAIAVILGNLLADTVNALLDPRIRID